MSTSNKVRAAALNQKGLVHLLLPVILILGLIAGVYLVTSGNPLKLFSRASVSKPIGPETSFTLIGPNDCPAGLVCTLQQIFLPQKGDEFSVKLYVRSDIEEANLFTAKMIFPKDLVEVKEIKTEGSFVKNWVENYYDNSTGEIALSGGVPDPGYKTQPGSESSLMAVIVFKAKALGKGPVSFTDSSAIYSNLNNINILTIKRGYDISVEVKPAVTPSPAPSSSAYPERIVKLAPPAAGPFAQAAGEMRVRFLSGKYDPKTPFNISASGEVSGLAANKKYMVGLCIKGIGCVSNKTIATDGSGNAVFTDAVWNNVRNTDSVDMVVTDAAFAITYLSGVYTPGFITNSPEPVLISSQKGDGNKDGKINLIDMSILQTDWKADKDNKKKIRDAVDINSDGLINSFDFSLLKKILQDSGIIKIKVK